jgi:hypothetical protein
MVALAEVEATARSAAVEALGFDRVDEVRAEPAVGSDGDEVLRITVVLKGGAGERVNDDGFLRTLLTIKRRLREAGDDHKTVIGYATPEELADNGDPES